jgi:heptosyltransferase-1
MRVLIVKVGAMGDVLHALPAVAALRRERPEWVIDWVVDARWRALLEDGPVVNKVHIAETREWSKAPLSGKTLRSVLELRKQLGAEQYDLAVDMQGTFRSGLIGKMSGAQRLVGYGDPRERVGRVYSEKVARRGAHVVQQGAALLAVAAGVELQPMEFTLPVIATAERWAERAVLKRPMCVLSAGGGWGAKLWPAESYGRLAVALRGMGFDVVVSAASEADALAQDVVAASAGGARLVACDVAGLVALLRRADLFVGGDSGPTHLAAALAVPLVALFGPTDPARNGPWGPGEKSILRDAAAVTSYKRTDASAMGTISVESVVVAVRGFMVP